MPDPTRTNLALGARQLPLAIFLLTNFAIISQLPAHEIGSAQVTASFSQERTYIVDLTIDASTLLARLEDLAGEDRSSNLNAVELEKRITLKTPLLLEKAHVQFDGKRVAPLFEYIAASSDHVSEGDVVEAVLRFSGPIPAGAQSFSWKYDLSYGSYALTLRNEQDPQPVRQWVEGDAVSVPFQLATKTRPLSRARTAKLYLKLGFTHIIPKGLDHILFVIGIFLLSTRLGAVLAQVTAFTLAHSITLALTIYGIVSLSPQIVEPAIAISIAYIGVENILTRTMSRWRVALVFAFGLLHGMGFAGVLSELGLPRSEFVTALISFNVGVELGQLAVIALAFLLVASWARKKPWYRARVVVPLSVLIALTGAYWTVARIQGL
ncbi:MAG TPA: HupE/UreJ family protein [Thermoanaerobaculia bacterium]|nr:HupE/UreJ family protein [Thermoanaerobaculia bacterium]